jgi:hypothetical protein
LTNCILGLSDGLPDFDRTIGGCVIFVLCVCVMSSDNRFPASPLPTPQRFSERIRRVTQTWAARVSLSTHEGRPVSASLVSVGLLVLSRCRNEPSASSDDYREEVAWELQRVSSSLRCLLILEKSVMQEIYRDGVVENASM